MAKREPVPLPRSCPYQHTFVGFRGPDIQRPCLKDEGHEGHHVVIEPHTGKLLAVPGAK